MWAYVITHPIQYYTPLLQQLARSAPDQVQVLYCSGELESSHSQAGFGVPYRWDVPLLEGYRYRFLENRAAHPSTATFGGLDNPELSRIIASRAYTAVVVNGWHFKSAWRTIIACWRHRIPVLVRSDSHLRGIATPLKRAKWPLYRSFIPRLDGCLAAGAWSSDYFEKYGASADHIFKIPHCVDNRRFEQEMLRLRPQREQLRSQWGIPADATVYLFAGKFIPVKRPLDFVNAIGRSSIARTQTSAESGIAASRYQVAGLTAGEGSRVAGSSPRVADFKAVDGPQAAAPRQTMTGNDQVGGLSVGDGRQGIGVPQSAAPWQAIAGNDRVVGLMAGDGPLRAACEEQARRSRAPVRFAGFLNQSQIAEAYAAADALVLPSETETWGMVVNEAMASGLPCIVSDRVGCGPDLIDRGVTGDVHAMGNVGALAELMGRYADAGKLAGMGQNARRKVKSYSVPAAADALLDAVETVRSRK